jgi:FlgD Ig-like domain
MPRTFVSLLSLGAALFVSTAFAGPIEDRLASATHWIDPAVVKTGILYDRVLALSGIERFDGRSGTPAASLRTWRQIADELRRASADPAAPEAETVIERARAHGNVISIGVLFDRYDRLRAEAKAEIGRGERPALGPASFETRTAFAVAALTPQTWRGGEARFVLDRAAYLSHARERLADLEVDLDDGRGFRRASFDVPLTAHYPTAGEKTLRVRANAGGEKLEASAAFVVRALAAPLPDDTLHVTGTIPYLGAVASGDAYVYLAPGRTALLNPAIVVEGFDLDNTMNWDELYALLNEQNLIENLRADGYDAVVLNFTDATDYIQRNAFLLVELLQELRGQLGPQTSVALAGASMGALVSRYALDYMEAHAIPHAVRVWISFDGPHLGANIPLGIQYWVKFFSGQSSDAAFLLSRLDRPAARQMLVHHYTTPPGASGQADPLFAGLASDFAAVGNWPSQPRRVAIANGSGTGLGQGFAAGAQIIQWSYSDLFVAVRGNVWAVPDQTPITKIFDGSIRLFIFPTTQVVNVSATRPYDDAPGGWRSTMADMDATPAPYGDIIALYPNHCFIPTMSSLAYDSPDLFHSVAADADPLAHTPFDAVYFPSANQEHVQVTAENAAWIRGEIEQGVTGVAPSALARRIQLAAPAPNPSSGPLEIDFALPRTSRADLRIFDLAGREVAHPLAATMAAGAHRVTWSGRDGAGHAAGPGVYFLRLATDHEAVTRRIVRLR